MASREVLIMIISEYFNVVTKMTAGTEEEYIKMIEIINNMEKRDNSPFFQKVILALVKEGVVPARKDFCSRKEYLSFEEIKTIMNDIYKHTAMGHPVELVKSRYEENPFALEMIEAFQDYH